MFGLLVKPKFVYFDRSIIRSRWNRFNKSPLEKAGNLVRKIARQSIKRRKKGGRPGPPGQPPRSRQPGNTPPFKMIYSVPHRLGTSVIVGMVGFNSKGTPGLHEHGGYAVRIVLLPGFSRQRRNVRYPKRDFMVPALRKSKQVLPSFWRNSIKS